MRKEETKSKRPASARTKASEKRVWRRPSLTQLSLESTATGQVGGIFDGAGVPAS